MGNTFQQWDHIVAAVITVILLIMQITFAFMMRKNKAAFLKYHRALGVTILLVVIIDMIFFPELRLVGLVAAPIILLQVVLGFIISRSKNNEKKFLKFHRPIGTVIFVLAIANLVLSTGTPKNSKLE